MALITAEINQFFEGLTEIHEEKERYSIEWAFEDAQQKMDVFKKDVIEKRLKSKCTLCKESKTVLKDFHGLQKLSKGTIRKSKIYARLFSNMYSLLSIVEIMISFLLVMGLSELSHSGAAHIDSHTFSLLFAGTFAFLKVIIERYWVKPMIEKWGWKLYERSIGHLRDVTLTLNKEATLYRQQVAEKEDSVQTDYYIDSEEEMMASLLTY